MPFQERWPSNVWNSQDKKTFLLMYSDAEWLLKDRKGQKIHQKLCLLIEHVMSVLEKEREFRRNRANHKPHCDFYGYQLKYTILQETTQKNTANLLKIPPNIRKSIKHWNYQWIYPNMMFTQYNLRLESDFTTLGRCSVTEFWVNFSCKSPPKHLNLALLQTF